MASKMFPFITRTWNPLGGECKHGCRYCWARKLAADRKMAKYQGEPRLYYRELGREFKPRDFVFVCDMLDLFGEWVPRIKIVLILDIIQNTPDADFLLLTKNPKRYLEFESLFPKNVVCGATIENDFDDYHESQAPGKHDRFKAMWELKHKRKMLAIEPILQFCENTFYEWILKVKPKFVAVGYDNYNNRLVEPKLEKTQELIQRLRKNGIQVYEKTIRKAWNE